MTRNRAIQLREVFNAWCDGQTIQYKYGTAWMDIKYDASFDPNDKYEYRIKPTPKLRAWRAEEVPVGALIRVKGNDVFAVFVIIGKRMDEIFFGADHKIHTTEEVFIAHEHSTDNGQTWHPCGTLDQ